MEKVFLGLPRYRFGRDNTVEVASHASQQHVVGAKISAGSMTCLNCNRLLAFALNLRPTGFRWLALLHDDVQPEAGWLDKLLAEALRVDADFLSAAVPYKSDAGFNSTSVRLADGTAFPLSQAQVRHPDFPDTFDASAAVAALARLPEPLKVECDGRSLWCNTGCMVCRLDRDWDWPRLAFQTRPIRPENCPAAETDPSTARS